MHIFYSCDIDIIEKRCRNGVGMMAFFKRKESSEQLLERLRKRAAEYEAAYNKDSNCRNLRNYTHARIELEQLEEEPGVRKTDKQK